jgi:hypothetical protein
MDYEWISILYKLTPLQGLDNCLPFLAAAPCAKIEHPFGAYLFTS